MALDDIWVKSKRKIVLFDKGKYAGRPDNRFVFANFTTVQTESGDLFLQPGNTCRAGIPAGQIIDSALSNDAVDEAFSLAQGEFYLDGEVQIVGEHQMGAYDGPDCWMACHKFTNI